MRRGHGRLHSLLQRLFEADRRAAARRRLQHYRAHLRRARVRSRSATQPRPPTSPPALRHAGYNENRNNPIGSYTVSADSIDIFPGAESYFDQEAGHRQVCRAARSAASFRWRDNTDRPLYELEPQLITNLSDRNREKQRVVHYEDIPAVLRNAILSAEDKRFFQHSGFDPVGIIRSAWVDVKRGKNAQGASTLSMQLARDMFLTPDAQLAPQAGRNHDHHAARTEAHQRADLRDVLQSGRSRAIAAASPFAASAKRRRPISAKTSARSRLPEAATLAGIVRGASYLQSLPPSRPRARPPQLRFSA